MNFQSDFKIMPVAKIGNPNWEYRIATWPQEIDPLVHKLYDKETNDPICYTRKTFKDNRIQNCKIVRKQNGDVIIEPGDGSSYHVKRYGTKNKPVEINNNEIPHEMLCVICKTNKVTHVIYECNHFIMCGECSKVLFEQDPKCPLCRGEIRMAPGKLFFA